MNIKEKMRKAIEQKLKPQEILKMLCPFELDFGLKIFANRNGHDFAILLRTEGESFIDDPRDLQSFLTQLRKNQPKESFTYYVTKVRYPPTIGDIYTCIYIDFK